MSPSPTTPLPGLALTLVALLSLGCRAALERTNRIVFAFNDRVDKALLAPASHVYQAAIPSLVRKGVSNFFDNLRSLDVIVNDLLQGKLAQGGSDTKRFLVNSTLGLGGILDVATAYGLEQHDEDFGQTLGRWGVGAGPYIVLPILGPTTLRDVPGIPVSVGLDPQTYVDDSSLRVPLRVFDAVDQRARAEGALAVRDESALDRYLFTREAFLQRRLFLIHDGAPPDTDVEDSFDDLLDDLLEDGDDL